MDADGFLYVTGRKDNMFIVAGKNVYPEEVEAVINRDKAVHESLVYYDEQFKNGIVALVTTFVDEELDQKRLLCLCEKELEFYKIPNKIIEVSNFEKTISGKIVRNQYLKYINKIVNITGTFTPLVRIEETIVPD